MVLANTVAIIAITSKSRPVKAKRLGILILSIAAPFDLIILVDIHTPIDLPGNDIFLVTTGVRVLGTPYTSSFVSVQAIHLLHISNLPIFCITSFSCKILREIGNQQIKRDAITSKKWVIIRRNKILPVLYTSKRPGK